MTMIYLPLTLLVILGLHKSSFVAATSESCLVHGYNEEMNADDVFEIDMDESVLKQIIADFDKDVRPFLTTGTSTNDFCLTSPYAAGTSVWDSGDGNEQRSDMKWYSPRNEETMKRYLKHVDSLGLKDLVREQLVETDEVVVYNILFLVRGHSDKHHFHLDWNDELGTNALTFLLPLNNFTVHMKYYDNDDEVRRYEYKYGKAIAFGGGFWHTTEKGHSEQQDVLLCVYLGSNDPKHWKYVLNNIGDESGYYNNPFKGFIKNENVDEGVDNCL